MRTGPSHSNIEQHRPLRLRPLPRPPREASEDTRHTEGADDEDDETWIHEWNPSPPEPDPRHA